MTFLEMLTWRGLVNNLAFWCIRSMNFQQMLGVQKVTRGLVPTQKPPGGLDGGFVFKEPKLVIFFCQESASRLLRGQPA